MILMYMSAGCSSKMRWRDHESTVLPTELAIRDDGDGLYTSILCKSTVEKIAIRTFPGELEQYDIEKNHRIDRKESYEVPGETLGFL